MRIFCMSAMCCFLLGAFIQCFLVTLYGGKRATLPCVSQFGHKINRDTRFRSGITRQTLVSGRACRSATGSSPLLGPLLKSTGDAFVFSSLPPDCRTYSAEVTRHFAAAISSFIAFARSYAIFCITVAYIWYYTASAMSRFFWENFILGAVLANDTIVLSL